MNRLKTFLGMTPLLFALALMAGAHYHLQQFWQGEIALGTAVKEINNQQFAQAETDLNSALQASPRNAHYYAHEALLFERMQPRRIETLLTADTGSTNSEELRAGVRAYEHVLQLNPDDDVAYHNLGWFHFLLAEDDEATACLRKAISLDSAIPLYHVSLGLQRERRGDQETALAEFKTALRLSPGLLDSRFFRDFKHRSAEQAERIISELIQEFERQLERAFDPIVAGKLAKLYLDRRPELALPLLERATASFPSLARPWANLALYFDQNGNEEAARSCYERALFIDGSDVLSSYRLARYFERHNKIAEAEQSYARAVNLFLRAESEHAGRVRRIYLSYYTLFDDIVPNGLTAYVMAGFNVPQVCRRLSQIHASTGDANEAARFADLATQYAAKIDFSDLP
jgi:tetratricopeptide (TPR) repeat protein